MDGTALFFLMVFACIMFNGLLSYKIKRVELDNKHREEMRMLELTHIESTVFPEFKDETHN